MTKEKISQLREKTREENRKEKIGTKYPLRENQVFPYMIKQGKPSPIKVGREDL